MNELILRIEGVTGGYFGEEIVHGISLDVNAGDFLGLIGPNGSGKTTLMRLATRILKPSAGTISFKSRDIHTMALKELAKKIAFVAQDIGNDFSFSVMEIVLMGRIPHLSRMQFESKKDIEIARDALAVTDCSHLMNKFIGELSAGEQQRVMIARALAQEPELIFLDEPTSHLDIGHQIKILDLLKNLNINKKMTIVMVQHDLNLASGYCGKIALISEGKLFKHGSARDVLTYQNIEAVYKTVVLVNDNPVTKKPNVILVPGDQLCERK